MNALLARLPWKYIGRRLVAALPLVWGVITLIFVLVELSPGTIADKFLSPDTPPEVRELIIAKYGLDQPATHRYFLLLRNLLTLDFGRSMANDVSVMQLIGTRLPNTVLLSTVTLLAMYPVGLVLGTLQAVRQGKLADHAGSVTSLFFYSMPSFWLALMLQLLLTYWWPILPTSGMHDTMVDFMTGPERWWDLALHLVLPGVAIGLAASAGVARHMRSSLLEVIRQDYIRTARAKGLPESRVIGVHALRNALLPIITLFGLTLPALFSGSVLIEQIFSWPGMGQLIVQAIFAQDTPVIIACFFFFTLLVVAGNLLADVLYAVVDPRIRLE